MFISIVTLFILFSNIAFSSLLEEDNSKFINSSQSPTLKKQDLKYLKERKLKKGFSFVERHKKIEQVRHLINTVSWKKVYAYADENGISKRLVSRIDKRRNKTITFQDYSNFTLKSD